MPRFNQNSKILHVWSTIILLQYGPMWIFFIIWVSSQLIVDDFLPISLDSTEKRRSMMFLVFNNRLCLKWPCMIHFLYSVIIRIKNCLCRTTLVVDWVREIDGVNFCIHIMWQPCFQRIDQGVEEFENFFDGWGRTFRYCPNYSCLIHRSFLQWVASSIWSFLTKIFRKKFLEPLFYSQL